MNIGIDKNNLLTIFNENIPQTKEYTYHVGGYSFSDFDTGIIVLHKKEWKIINLKNLGDTMSVVYLKDKKIGKINFEPNTFKQAFGLFQTFDEMTGKKLFFLPPLSWNRINDPLLNEFMRKMQIDIIFHQDKKGTHNGMYIEGAEEFRAGKNDQEILNFLFGLCLLYGKLDIKKGELLAMKIQLPLFGGYMNMQEELDDMIKKLQQAGIFLKADKLPNKNGITYQISSNDYELLEIFAKWYEAVEKFEKITKREFTQEMKIKLLDFIQTNPEIPQEGKAEVMKQIEKGTIKLLTK